MFLFLTSLLLAPEASFRGRLSDGYIYNVVKV